mgnify:CR=1 FL=1
MSEWVWTSDETKRLINSVSSYVLVMSLILILIVVLIVPPLYLEYRGSPQFIGLSIRASILIAGLLLLIVYPYMYVRSVRKAIRCLRKVEIGNLSLTLSTINGVYTARLSEVIICHKAIKIWRSRSSAYNIFIIYRGLVYEIPELKPEDYGALKQILKGYGMDLNECADDLSRYVCIGQPQQQ